MVEQALARRLMTSASAVVLAVVLPGAAGGATPGVNGKIVFASDRGEPASEIYVMDGDGGAVTRLTTSAGDDLEPAWSPDGTRIAFTSRRDGDAEIYVMNADGSGVRRLTTSLGFDGEPSWSPDGKRIAFRSMRDGDAEIYVVDVDGTGAMNVTRSPSTRDSNPAWAPDGARIVFARDPGTGSDLYAIAVDGAEATLLFAGTGNETEPTWSPTGASLAFTSDGDGDAEVYVVPVGGGDPAQLTDHPATDRAPSWGPDGAVIAFETDRDGSADVYVMKIDGTEARNLSNDPGRDTSPDWQSIAAYAQPDLAVAPSVGPFIGMDVYAPGGAAQTVEARGHRSLTQRYTVRLENDGNRVDEFTLEEIPSASIRTHYRVRGSDVTALVAHGGLRVRLRPGRRVTISLELSLTAGARIGSRPVLGLRATSSGQDPRRDTVRIGVRVMPVTPYSYGYPVKPFFVQHAVRGQFADPRIVPGPPGAAVTGQYHFGVDVSVPDGTAVYATASGYVLTHPLHYDVVIVQRTDGVVLEYWHVVPAVRPGLVAVAYRTMIGRITHGQRHVHVSERRAGVYANPLRTGAMGPYSDDSRPDVREITFSRGGREITSALRGVVDIVVVLDDSAPVTPPAPWDRAVLMPSLVRWRVLDERGREARRWQTILDARERLPPPPLAVVYAPGTRQNRPNRRGSYRIYLSQGWDSSSLKSGSYELEVSATDIRGNTASQRATFVVANGA